MLLSGWSALFPSFIHQLYHHFAEFWYDLLIWSEGFEQHTAAPILRSIAGWLCFFFQRVFRRFSNSWRTPNHAKLDNFSYWNPLFSGSPILKPSWIHSMHGNAVGGYIHHSPIKTVFQMAQFFGLLHGAKNTYTIRTLIVDHPKWWMITFSKCRRGGSCISRVYLKLFLSFYKCRAPSCQAFIDPHNDSWADDRLLFFYHLPSGND